MALFPLDGPSVQDLISVTTSETEVKVGSSALTERKVVTIQPIDGNIRLFFDTGLATDHGILVRKERVMSFEASESQKIYFKTESGTVTVIVIERA